jgi:hypothetical protein
MLPTAYSQPLKLRTEMVGKSINDKDAIKNMKWEMRHLLVVINPDKSKIIIYSDPEESYSIIKATTRPETKPSNGRVNYDYVTVDDNGEKVTITWDTPKNDSIEDQLTYLYIYQGKYVYVYALSKD